MPGGVGWYWISGSSPLTILTMFRVATSTCALPALADFAAGVSAASPTANILGYPSGCRTWRDFLMGMGSATADGSSVESREIGLGDV
jgi:hypothetical protein